MAVPVFGSKSLRQGLEAPAQRPGPRVEREHLPGRVDCLGPVLAGPAEIERVPEHRRRLQERQRPLGVRGVVAVDVENPALPEIGTRRPGVGVDRMQLGIHRPDVDPLLAGLPRHRRLRLPVGHAAVLQVRLRQRLQHGVGVIGPLHLSGVGLQREDPVEGRAEVERVVDEERRRRPDGRRPVGLASRRACGFDGGRAGSARRRRCASSRPRSSPPTFSGVIWVSGENFCARRSPLKVDHAVSCAAADPASAASIATSGRKRRRAVIGRTFQA